MTISFQMASGSAPARKFKLREWMPPESALRVMAP
jgi:hypothetical protein